MKKITIGLLTITLVLVFSSCKDKLYNKYLANSPVYTSYEDFRSSVKFEAPHDLTTKGSIYIKDNYFSDGIRQFNE